MRGLTRLQGDYFYRDIGPYWRDLSWQVAAVADMNRDGGPDLLYQNARTGALEFAQMHLFAGLVELWSEIPLSPARVSDTAWKIKSVGDFNRDGHADLVWQHEIDGRIAIWFMNRYVQYSGEPLGPGQVPDIQWKIVGSGDFNGDGWRDLVWQHQANGRIAVWKMQGTVLLDGDLIVPGQVADLDWKIRAVGDIDGDNWPDLIWHHRVTGDVATWLMNGTTKVSGIVFGHAPDTNWQLVGPR